MSEVTLNDVLKEIQKTNARLDKIDTKNDDRFEFIKREFQTMRQDMSSEFQDVRGEMAREFQNVRGEIAQFRAETNARFDRVDKKLDATFEQVGRTVEDVADLKTRVSRLEASSA